ncbi:apolipophorins-like protein, partial [Leptotrombidium deliense]
MYSKVILLLSALFVFGDGAPLNIESSDVCSTQCSEAENLFYEIGKTYEYTLDTKTELKLEDQIVNVRISGLARMHYAKKCEFRLQLRGVRVEGVDKKQLRAEDLERETLTFAFNDGLISNVCPSLNEKSNILNIKKAILSAMQLSTKMLGPLKVVEERDILGDCETEYKTENQDGLTITKKKNLKTCRNRMIADTALFQNAILERMLERSTEVMQNNYECTQVISSNYKFFDKIECRETSHYMDYSRESAIKMRFYRILVKDPIPEHEFKKQSLLYTREDDHVVSIEEASKLLSKLCQSTVNDINDQSMKYFKRLSYALKGLEYDDINRMLSQVQMEGGIDGCISMKLHGLLESALLMSGGKAALRYMTEDIRSFDTSNPRKMMTLLSLPFISHPTEESVKAILPMMSNIKSPRLMLLATAMIGNFVRNNASCPEMMPAVKDAVNLLGNRLPNKCASNPREIKNVVALLKAIGNIGFLTDEVFAKIVGCAKSTSTESVVRAAALNVLKKSNACNYPSEQSTELKTLLNILMTKSDETDEIQIAAFKAFMTCSKGFGEEFIVKEAIVMSRNRANPRLAHYVYTYLNNLKKNKNPMYRKLRMEMITKDITDITMNDERVADEKMSYNKLYTYYSNELQMGIHFEMDYIMERNLKHPRALTVSAYIPIHERNIQLFEIGLRQDIDDQSISNLEKFLMEQNYEELMNIAKDMINDRWNDVNQEKMEKLQQLVMKLQESVKMLSMHFDYNENTLLCGSYSFMDSFIKREFKREAFLGWAQGRGRPSMHHLANHPMIAKIKNVFKERGYGLILLDSSIEIPTVSGLPEIAAARSVFVSGSTGVRERQNMINLMPNMGLSICLSIKTFINREEMVGLKWKTTAVSNLRMIVKMTNNDNEKSIELNLPSAKTDLIKFTSALYKDTEFGEEMYSMQGAPKKECQRDMFGLTACMVNHITPEFDLLKVQQFWISLEHSHGNNDGWKATLVYPNSRNNRYMIELKAPR